MNMRHRFLRKKDYSLRVFANEGQAAEQLAKRLYEMVDRVSEKEIVVVCIGSDRSTGDSLGPVVGSILQAEGLRFFHVYGTLQQPIHAVNLHERLSKINQRHPKAFIIAVDACLGKSTNVGSITLAEGPVYPGAAVKKSLPPVGDVHLAGIVNVGGLMEYTVLQNTRLSTVVELAEVIATAMTRVDAKLTDKNHISTFIDFLPQRQIR